MQLFFALTLFTSATLLFLVQPMFAKMVLPRLGGTPAVWNTCMVFYQAVLLAGYLYAHFSTKWLGARRQAAIHLVILLLPWLVLPIGIAASQVPSGGSNPVPWLLLLMLGSVGLPFFAVSASAPMLQKWFSDTGHPAGKDPYFLYAASNLGSMLALLGYPILMEPNLALISQSRFWAAGYGLLMALTAGCAVWLWRSRGPVAAAVAGGPSLTVETTGLKESAEDSYAVPTWPRRLRWLALSFAPSSLLLGVTTFITTDLAPMPLLWVIPLALYLLSFVFVFARHKVLPHWLMVLIQPLLIVIVTVVFQETGSESMLTMILLHLGMFFVTTMVCHGELARTRPAASYLTEFYIWMSVGGVLGGLFNALVAPVMFPTVIEYPLVIAVACMLRPPAKPNDHPVRSRWLDLVIPIWLYFFLKELTNWVGPSYFGWIEVTWQAVSVLLLTGLVAVTFRSWPARVIVASLVFLAAMFLAFEWFAPERSQELMQWAQAKKWLPELRGFLKDHHLAALASFAVSSKFVLTFGVIAAITFFLRPVRFGMAIGVVFLVGHAYFGHEQDVIYTARSFFGVLRVKNDTDDKTHTLMHGSTIHGVQSWDEERPERALEPWTYYHHDGPLGEALLGLLDRRKPQEMGVIGLGTGTTAAYHRDFKKLHLTYFEIDPLVVQIDNFGENLEEKKAPKFFTYLYDAKLYGCEPEIVLGDARLSLVDQPDNHFDALIVDAFSSDAIPIHLMTREAMALYLQKLKPDGILLVHISNRYFNLAPVVGNLADDAGYVARVENDSGDSDNGKYASEWVLVVRDQRRLGELAGDIDWKEIPHDDRVGVWTDDFSNILMVLTWYRDSNLDKFLQTGRWGEPKEEPAEE